MRCSCAASTIWPMNQSDKESDDSADNVLMVQNADQDLLHERTPPDIHTCAMEQALLIVHDYVIRNFSYPFWKLRHHHIVLLWLCVMAT